MAPKTPQGTSKTPKAPAAGGPIPFTGIPAPQSVLQRRSFMPNPSSTSAGTKSFQNMTPEQQSLLAEAISIHSPGLIDPGRRRAESVGSESTLGGAGGGRQYQQSPVPTTFSPGNPNHSSVSPSSSSTILASPLSYNQSPQARRASTSRPGASPESSPYGQSSNIRAVNAAYSAIPPVTTASLQQSFASATSSPTAESPSGPRPLRLSTGTAASSGTTRSLVKQPLFQRPPSAGSSAGNLLRGTNTTANGGINSSLPGVLGSPVQNQVQSQNQFPASLEGIELGDRVVVESMGLTGYLRFVGTAEFKTGVWAGIELDTPIGKNDGSVGGVVYFNCRPKCGIFVLAAKVVKTELLLPFTSIPAAPAPSPSAPEDAHTTPPPQTVNHAAQAASRITAGSRASKYIGVTANQLKLRNVMPQPGNSRILSQQQQQQQQQQQASTSANDNPTGSPTTARTIPIGLSNRQTTSPTPMAPTTRTGLGSRLSQVGSKSSLLSQANRTGTHNRTGSTTSPPGTLGSRPRTSPTPGRLMTSPRRLSSRNSDNSDGNSNNNSANTSAVLSPHNLLDQATLIQMAESPQGNLAVQFQQLQLDLGVAVAENNMLKTEVNQTKTQLEMTRLLEKRDSLSYDERVFLSKSLGRGGIDERLGQELEEMHTMKAEWEKERAAKDQEIKGITEKMTQAWIDAARSQKERTALIQEKNELEDKLKVLEDNGGAGSASGPVSEEQQDMIDSLKRDLEDADEKIASMEVTIQDLNDRTIEDEARMMALEESMLTSQADYAEQLTLLESERDDLQLRLDDLEVILKVTTEALQSKLEAALRDASHSEEQLHEVQARLEHESEIRRTKESEAESKLKDVEAELQESQSLLTKSEKLAKVLEEKVKEYESLIAKREQEIADLKHELEDLADMVQSEEVDRMRKVWEHEKKRLEDAVSDDITVITGLRTEIQTLELNETELQIKIEELEATLAIQEASKTELTSEVSRLQTVSSEAQAQFEKERSELEAKVAESEKAIELHEAETKDKLENLESIALTVETWKEQCEAMQLEMIQKTAKAEDVGFELVETQAQRDLFKQEAQSARKELEDKISQLVDFERLQLEHMSAQDEKSQLLNKVSELEAALALSVSVPPKPPSPTDVDAVEPNQKRTELEEEVAHLKQMVHDLTRENIAVASVNKKLMQEHDNLMEAHKHVETECLKLMDEVERLHAESLAAVGESTDAEAQEEKDGSDLMENAEPKTVASDKEIGPASQSQSVIRLEGLLKEKQALLDRLTQSHASEMRELRQRYVDLDRSKAYEVMQLNKELTELESLIESKIFHEADLEEEVQRKQKQIDRLHYEVSDLKSQLSHATMAMNELNNGGRMAQPLASSSSLRGEYRTSTATASVAPPSQRARSSSITAANNHKPNSSRARKEEQQSSFCEICEVEGHDIISCTAVFGAGNNSNPRSKAAPVSAIAVNSTPFPEDMEDERPYCENCEEFGLHYTDECPNESLTY